MNAEEIRRRLKDLALDRNEYKINAGAAMVLYGLREETHDLDIWCSKKQGDALAQQYGAEMLDNGIRRFTPAEDVEIYENLLPGETVFLKGIPVAAMEDVLAFKRSLNREKDQKDIVVLENALAERNKHLNAEISPVRPSDIAACTDIYNYYIKNTCITLEEDLITPEEFGERVKRITGSYPYIVARDHTGRPVGYAYLDVFNERSAYRCTADLSIYVEYSLRHDGIGQKLYTEIERLGRECGIENIISIITSDNRASLSFHNKIGFTEIGMMHKVAFKFGKYLDVSFCQKRICECRQ